MDPPDLRDRLLHAAERLVDHDGLDALSMRTLAAKTDASRQAPYLHFASKEALLAALAAIGLRRERAWATAAVTDDARSSLMALGQAHLRLQREHPGLYALAHGGVPKQASPELQEEAVASFALLREVVTRLSAEGTPLGVLRTRCMVAWAFVSGVGNLAEMASLPASIPGDPGAWLREGLDALVLGWSSGAARSPAPGPKKRRRR